MQSILDLIFEYLGYYESQNEEDEILSKKSECYLEALSKVDINNINIIDYYDCYMIPFYRYLHKTTYEALNENNKDILRQVAVLIVDELIDRIDIMAYCLCD